MTKAHFRTVKTKSGSTTKQLVKASRPKKAVKKSTKRK